MIPPDSQDPATALTISLPEEGDPEATFNPRSELIKPTHFHSAESMLETPAAGGMPTAAPWAVAAPGEATAPGANPLAPGYRLDRVVGVGGMGEVWEATQESLGRKVAIKKIRSEHTKSKSRHLSEMLSRSFQHEALITACLDHPNIVPVYDIGRDPNGEPLLAMKLVRGLAWDDLIRADRALPLSEQLHKHLPILVDVAQAVAFAHSRGVLHRDIKPAQVMVGEFGEVLLLDWGIACYFSTGDEAETKGFFGDAGGTHAPVPLMKAMNPAGTPSFMAPEQTQSTPEGLGPWTDVFLLGATLYSLLAGRPPYANTPSPRAASALAAKCKWENLESFSTEERRIPPELIRVCARAMSRNPWDRHGSVNEFVEEVQAYLHGTGRRRESMELANRAIELLNTKAGGYGHLMEAGRLLVQSRTIWEENPQVDDLEQLLHERFASAALDRGDLELARDEASAMPAGKRREALLATIHKRLRLQERLPKERIAYGIATVVLLLLVVASLLVALNVHRAANGRAAAPRVALSLPMELLDLGVLSERQAVELGAARRATRADQ